VRLCIDDFGTGTSSLGHLHSFPVDTLKIDRSFVSQIGFSGNSARLVETIVALSHTLGMASVAHGVETREQLEFLRQLGPEFAQGFLFSAPRTLIGRYRRPARAEPRRTRPLTASRRDAALPMHTGS
jgi:diguanylate cyclase